MNNTTLAVLFHRFGPYHHARLHAVSKMGHLVAIEFSGADQVYAWDRVNQSQLFQHVTLFQDSDIETEPMTEVLGRLYKVMNETKPTVVAIPGWSSKGSLAVFSWCMDNAVPIVIMSDSTLHDSRRVFWKEAIKKRLLGLCASAFVAGSPHVEYTMMLGMQREYILTGYDVVDNDYFMRGAAQAKKNAEQWRLQLGLPDRFFLVIARFLREDVTKSPIKNLNGLIHAYYQYRKLAGQDAWSLVILGDGEIRSELEKIVKDLGIESAVLMPGFKQYSELPLYYGLADAFILPSMKETWGLVVNEAMAAGLPILVSENCGCAADLLEDCQNGFLLNPHDGNRMAACMLRMASDSCDRIAMGQASRQIIAHWTPQTFAENLWRAVETARTEPRKKVALLDKALLSGLLWYRRH